MVLAAAALFAISLLFGSRHGTLWTWQQQLRMRWQADDEHVLRCIYEVLERKELAPAIHGQIRSEAVSKSTLSQSLGWNPRHLQQVIDRLTRSNWILDNKGRGDVTLSVAGIQQSYRAVRRHRLLELYFSRWADLSSDAIDRCADYTEHSLDDELLARLERDALDLGTPVDPPPSIHPIG